MKFRVTSDRRSLKNKIYKENKNMYKIKDRGEWVVNQHGKHLTFSDRQKALQFILDNFELFDKSGFKIVKSRKKKQG